MPGAMNMNSRTVPRPAAPSPEQPIVTRLLPFIRHATAVPFAKVISRAKGPSK